MTDPSPKKPFNSYIQYTSLGFQMLGFLAIFGYLGHWADQSLKNQTPVFTLLGLLFGVIGSTVYIIRKLNRNQD